MIPKIIHYCWLSNDPIPKKLQNCMYSWKKYFSEYEMMLWNFERFDMNSNNWVKQAFEQRKYAYAADYIRLYAVYNHGGIYLDMDIEVIKPFNVKLLEGPIMLAHENNEIKSIEAGCFGAEQGHPYIKKCLNFYNNRQFVLEDALAYKYTLPKLMRDALEDNNEINILPEDFFTAKSLKTGIITITNNTYCIHHFAGSWLPVSMQFYEKIRNGAIKLFGYTLGIIIVSPVYIVARLLSSGLKGLKDSVIKKLQSIVRRDK